MAPPHPPERASPLQHFPGFRRSDVLACGRPSLVRYCAHTKQAPLNLKLTLCRLTIAALMRLLQSYVPTGD